MSTGCKDCHADMPRGCTSVSAFLIRMPCIQDRLDRPRPSSIAVQLVKAEARQVHVARIGCGVQSAEDETQAIDVLRLDAALVARGEKLFEPFVSKALDRHWNQCHLRGYESQSGHTFIHVHDCRDLSGASTFGTV